MKRLDPLVPPRVRASNDEVFAAALRGGKAAAIDAFGEIVDVPVARWSAEADDSDNRLLDYCVGSTIDIGCGPGRMTVALTLRGVHALGIDVVPEAVAQTKARGASAVVGDLFHVVPTKAAGTPRFSPTEISASAATQWCCCNGCVASCTPEAGSCSTSRSPVQDSRPSPCGCESVR